MKEKELTFETAYQRLEEILDKMNKQTIGLDEAIVLYEEADKLLQFCTEKLDVAEKKIQVLMKGVDGELELDSHGRPKVDTFTLNQNSGVLK